MQDAHASSTDSAAQAVMLLSILLPLPLAGPYDYRADVDLRLERGDFVIVPLGSREVTGVVWGEGSGDVGTGKLRDVVARLDAPALPDVLCRFIDWVAQYTMAPPGAVLAMAMRAPAALEPPRGLAAWRRSENAPLLAALRLTAERQRVLDVLADGPPRPTAELAREAGVGVGVVKSLAAAGALVAIELPPPAAFEAPDPECAGPTLSAAQANAAATLSKKVRDGGFAVTALDGVTGAGKTEVYFEAIAQALRDGRQALVLLPEIALGAQWLDRFTTRFGVAPAQWHSDLTAAERRVAWRAVAFGEARVVVGARSALFLPFPDLGLIVVDEEHDAAYKQEDGVVYQARDMAVVRARLTDIPIVLVSATPSLETVQNIAAGRYDALHLPDRHGGAKLPIISAIDLRSDKPPRQSWLSPTLRQALSETLAAGEQALLFLNRRGYAPLTLCRACGHRLQCPRCTAWLVEHRLVSRLQCHHCGFQVPFPHSCPACKAEGMLAACGPGVERLSEEVAALLPAARTAMMTSDTITGPLAAAEFIRRVQDHEVDLLIGTQMIAKGHHFPMLTLVGVVDADLGLHGGDLRATERTYQLLHQVAGRAGRADRPGRVLLQTYEPEHPVMQALVAGDRDRFLESEAEDRRSAGMPPFGRLAALILAGPDAETVDGAARLLARGAPHGEGIQVWGPAPAPLAVLRGRHRRRFLLKCRRDIAPQPLLRAWLAPVKLPGSVRLQIDIDPYSFL
jgi:primosomal protein N' (replication factor Y) (superfamily II helicase)